MKSRSLHRSRNVTGVINFVLQIVIDDCKLIKHEPPVHPRVPCQIFCMDNVHLYGICIRRKPYGSDRPASVQVHSYITRTVNELEQFSFNLAFLI